MYVYNIALNTSFLVVGLYIYIREFAWEGMSHNKQQPSGSFCWLYEMESNMVSSLTFKLV